MKKFLKIFGIIILVLAILIVAGLLYGYFTFRKSLPVTSGTIKVEYTGHEIKIIRDKNGVPHIYAQNRNDALFALGYVNAQDRLWQMELLRIAVRGELSEMGGEKYLDQDIFAKTVGFLRISQESLNYYDEEIKFYLSAYAHGVNEYIEQNKNNLPLELSIAGVKPEPWKPEDSLAIAKMMAWEQSGNWESELVRSEFTQIYGSQIAGEFFPAYSDKNILITEGASHVGASFMTPYQSQGNHQENFNFLEASQEFKELLGIPNSLGSNNWVVDGTKTTTGRPILANDPHLSLPLPSIWYESHLKDNEHDVAGVNIPGIPAIIIGHNKNIAWGVTNGSADTEDLYIEKIRKNNGQYEYLYKDQWLPIKVIKEKIKIKGKEEKEIEILFTHHGPIINPILAGKNELLMIPSFSNVKETLSLQWIGYKNTMEAKGMLLIDNAKNWSEFVEGVKYFQLPALNFVYADINGNIGYHLSGLIPTRAKKSGAVPVPGWTGGYEWTGTIPFEEMPSQYNPEKHYLLSANNKIISSQYPYYIDYQFESPYRAERIDQMIKAKDKLSIDDFERMQADTYSIEAQKIKNIIINSLEKYPDKISREERVKKAYELLKKWDGHITKDSPEASIYNVFKQKIIERLLQDKEMNSQIREHYLSLYSPVSTGYPLVTILSDGKSLWLKRLEKNYNLSKDELIYESLKQAVEELKNKFGEDVNNWKWGNLHTIKFTHPFAFLSILDKLLSVGPFPNGGDGETVNLGMYMPSDPYSQVAGPSYRQIIDLSDLDKSLTVLPIGESEHRLSPHYADQASLWLEVKYHPMRFSDESIKRDQEAVLILSPKK